MIPSMLILAAAVIALVALPVARASGDRRAVALAALLGLAIAAGGAALYLRLGNPGYPDQAAVPADMDSRQRA